MNASDFNFFDAAEKSTALGSVDKVTHNGNAMHSVRAPAPQVCQPAVNDDDKSLSQRVLEKQIARAPNFSAWKGSESVLRAAYVLTCSPPAMPN